MNAQTTAAMKVYNFTQSENFSSMILYGTFMVTNLDYIGIVDYSIKAIIGGVVWFGLKLIAEHYSQKLKQHSEEKRKKAEEARKEFTDDNSTGSTTKTHD